MSLYKSFIDYWVVQPFSICASEQEKEYTVGYRGAGWRNRVRRGCDRRSVEGFGNHSMDNRGIEGKKSAGGYRCAYIAHHLLTRSFPSLSFRHDETVAFTLLGEIATSCPRERDSGTGRTFRKRVE